MFIACVSLILGFLLLVKGADYFVEGASTIAKKLHIPAFIVGLTIVAFGTSAPELAVSVSAAIKGSNDIAIGNVVGSNLFNLLVVLGCSALIKPMIVEANMIKRDFPISILVAVVLGILSLDMIYGKEAMVLGRVDGTILLVLFGLYMYITVRLALKVRKGSQPDEEVDDDSSLLKSIIICVLGLIGIVIGGNIAVDGAKEIARGFGLSEAFIGLTIVALGTSLPELVTSIVAAKKGKSDIALGNVLGSNIFNVLLILGTSATIFPMDMSSTYLYDVLILIIVSLLVFVPVFITKKVGRGLGIAMVLSYVGYTIYLFVR